MTKKTELINYLRDSLKSLKDKSLKDRANAFIKSYNKDEKSVTVLDLRALAKEIDNALPKAVEASIKKPTTASKSKLKAPAADKAAVKEEPKKKLSKKPVAPEKKEAEKPVERFPETLELKDLKLKKLKVKDFAELTKLLESDKEIYFAAEWTKEQLKDYDYTAGLSVQKPKSFEKDVDILSLVYLGDNTIGVAVSNYTDMVYTFIPEDIKKRAINTIPIDIYEVA